MIKQSQLLPEENYHCYWITFKTKDNKVKKYSYYFNEKDHSRYLDEYNNYGFREQLVSDSFTYFMDIYKSNPLNIKTDVKYFHKKVE